MIHRHNQQHHKYTRANAEWLFEQFASWNPKSSRDITTCSRTPTSAFLSMAQGMEERGGPDATDNGSVRKRAPHWN
jgi:hypothetical protein